MILLNQLLGVLWTIFIIYWLILALKAKKSIRNSNWWKGAIFRALIAILIIILFQMQSFQQFAISYNLAPHESIGIVGVILCALGLALVVWARIHLGKNWGMPMSTKENPELVTTGPYNWVRHPIYTGILLAALGSSLIDGLWWFVFFIFFAIYFAYSVRVEEKTLLAQFPNEYKAYQKRTKMLIPFIV